MGCCCSQDSLPPVPKEIRPDPNPSVIMDVVVVKIGNLSKMLLLKLLCN
jgi:hypothetical protein